jgi:dTDP-4-amino-4,6-dideoxygalactose transaminase
MIKIPLFKVYMNPFVDEDLLQTLHSGYIGQGSKVVIFESELSERIGNPHCLSLGAGTHGLHLALRDAGVGVGDHVITTPLSCTATAFPILMQGASIIWADIQPNTVNIDPVEVEKSITEKTKAIICVHWGGFCCDMEELYAIANKHKIALIEDAAHAFGATYKNSVIGDCTYSNYTMFSFQAIKTLTSVEGGALFTRTQDSYERIKLMRWYGIDREGLRRDLRCEDPIPEDLWGYKYNQNDVFATIGLKNLERVDQLLKIAKENVEYYKKELKDILGITLLQLTEDRKSSNWLFTILVENRTSFAAMMADRGIHTSRVHERIDKHPCVKEFVKSLPKLESIMPKYLCLPCGWWVTKEDREYIIDTIKKGW